MSVGNFQKLPDLPDGWIRSTLGDEFVWGSGGTPLRSKPHYYHGEIPWAVIGDLNDGIVTGTRESITEDGLRNSSAKWVEEGSVLVAMYGSIGKLGIAGRRMTTNQAIAFAKPGKNDNKFLFYYLLKERANLNGFGIGNTQKNISQTLIKSYPFPVPPLSEQQRIVVKIEELFSQLDAGVAALQQAKAQLQRYRQAVLKAAVTGELTKEWREAHKKQCGITDATGPYPIPAYWTWVTISDIGAVTGGLTKNKKRQSYQLKMPYLRVANVYSNELRLEDVEEIGIQESELKRVLLQKGDLLIVEGNGSSDQIGRVSIWDGSINPCVHQNHIIKVRFKIIEIGRLVMYWLLSPLGREQISKVASSTSGLYTLSLSKVNALPVPLPPMEEQGEILMELEYRLSIIDKLEEQITANLSKTELLRNAILKNAFKGKFSHKNIEDRPNLESLDSIQMKNDHDVYQLMMKGFTS